MDLNVLPECYIDTKLTTILVPPKGHYNHQKGTHVLKRMKEKLMNEFALGIVDEDFEDRAYTQEFTLVYDFPGCLQLLRHPDRAHFLILRCPGMETWIINRARESTLTLEAFGLPEEISALKKITKTSKSGSDDPYSENFRRLFKALKQADRPSIKVLTLWISYLKENPYTVDINWLVEETDRIIDQP